jgi:glycerophosphoryl diester phosphodiesterase
MNLLRLCVLFVGAWFISCSAQGVTVYGHRGARGLAAENTLIAFNQALKHHVDAVDLDIVMTQDNVLVVYHDLTLNPDITRDADGHWMGDDAVIAIKNLTLDTIKTFNVGGIRPNTRYSEIYHAQQSSGEWAHIPTLEEAIQYIKTHADYPVGFQIEVKTDPTQPQISASPEVIMVALNKIIEQEGIAQRTKVQAFEWECLFWLQKINPSVQTAYLTETHALPPLSLDDVEKKALWTGGYFLKDFYSIPHMIRALGGHWWDAEDIELTQENIDEAHQLGLKVAAWSWPERTSGLDINLTIIRHLLSMGVDGIITDRPDLVVPLTHA